MGHKRGRGGKGKSNNDRNNDNTSQPRPGFVPPVGDKGKKTRKAGKDISTEKTTVGVLPSDDDTYSNVDEESRGNFEDKRTNDRNLPTDEIDICTIEETEVIVDNQTEYEVLQKIDKSPDNYSMTSLMKKEKEQMLKLSKQNKLEEGIKYALRRMVNRCKEAGEEVTPLTPLEKITIRFYNAYSTHA